jgi:hypothetical protein
LFFFAVYVTYVDVQCSYEYAHNFLIMSRNSHWKRKKLFRHTAAVMFWSISNMIDSVNHLFELSTCIVSEIRRYVARHRSYCFIHVTLTCIVETVNWFFYIFTSNHINFHYLSSRVDERLPIINYCMRDATKKITFHMPNKILVLLHATAS